MLRRLKVVFRIYRDGQRSTRNLAWTSWCCSYDSRGHGRLFDTSVNDSSKSKKYLGRLHQSDQMGFGSRRSVERSNRGLSISARSLVRGLLALDHPANPLDQLARRPGRRIRDRLCASQQRDQFARHRGSELGGCVPPWSRLECAVITGLDVIEGDSRLGSIHCRLKPTWAPSC